MTAGLCPTDGPRMVPGRSASGPCGSDVYQRWGWGQCWGVGSAMGGADRDGGWGSPPRWTLLQGQVLGFGGA